MGSLLSTNTCTIEGSGPPISTEKLQTGDLLLFVGGKGLLSHAIEMGTQSPFTHCAIVVRDPRWTTPKLYGLYAWESSSNSFADAENQRFKMGVQMSTFDRRIKEAKKWGKKVYVRQLTCDRGAQFESRLAHTHNAVHNLPYDSSPEDWLKALCIELGIPEFSNQTVQRHDQFWCSALVSFIYVSLGFLPKDTPWTVLAPERLSTLSKQPLIFMNCKLGPERLLK